MRRAPAGRPPRQRPARKANVDAVTSPSDPGSRRARSRTTTRSRSRRRRVVEPTAGRAGPGGGSGVVDRLARGELRAARIGRDTPRFPGHAGAQESVDLGAVSRPRQRLARRSERGRGDQEVAGGRGGGRRGGGELARDQDIVVAERRVPGPSEPGGMGERRGPSRPGWRGASTSGGSRRGSGSEAACTPRIAGPAGVRPRAPPAGSSAPSELVALGGVDEVAGHEHGLRPPQRSPSPPSAATTWV